MGLASPIQSLWLGSPDLRYVEIALSHAKNSGFHVTDHQLHSLLEKRFTTRAAACFHVTNLLRLKRVLVAHGVVFHVTDSARLAERGEAIREPVRLVSASLGSNSPRHE